MHIIDLKNKTKEMEENKYLKRHNRIFFNVKKTLTFIKKKTRKLEIIFFNLKTKDPLHLENDKISLNNFWARKEI